MTVYVKMVDNSKFDPGIFKTPVLVIKCNKLEQAGKVFMAAKKHPEIERLSIVPYKPNHDRGVVYIRRNFNELDESWFNPNRKRKGNG